MSFDVTIDQAQPPLRVVLRDGMLEYDRSGAMGEMAAYLLSARRGLGAFGHPVDPQNIRDGADAHALLVTTFRLENVAIVEGESEVRQAYRAKPPRGVF